MAMEMKGSGATVAMRAKILSTVRMKTVHVTCMELAAAPRRIAVTVSKAGLVLIAPCVLAHMGELGLGTQQVGTIMRT